MYKNVRLKIYEKKQTFDSLNSNKKFSVVKQIVNFIYFSCRTVFYFAFRFGSVFI